MKKVFISLIFLTLLFAFSIVGNAALLSPGISVLQQSVTMEKSGVAKNDVVFTPEDFAYAVGATDIVSVKITTLPPTESGVLKLGSVDVTPGEVIPAERISSLRFIPAAKGVRAVFGFIPYESGYEEEFVCTISMNDALPPVPVTENDKIESLAGVTVNDTLPLKNEIENVTFSIEDGASHGTVEIIDTLTGQYCYTPDDAFYGTDTFTFYATSSSGERSNISKVTVKVHSNEKNFVYTDMENSEYHLAAAMLAKNDIMLGELKDGKRLFNPDKNVSRSDFLIMAMDTANIAPTEDAPTFADSESFAPYESKYIAAAEKLGIAVGIDTENGREFLPDQNITAEEASLIICRIGALEGYDFIEDDISVSVMADEHYDALGVLVSADMCASVDAGSDITRADAAKMLYSLLNAEKD